MTSAAGARHTESEQVEPTSAKPGAGRPERRTSRVRPTCAKPAGGFVAAMRSPCVTVVGDGRAPYYLVQRGSPFVIDA